MKFDSFAIARCEHCKSVMMYDAHKEYTSEDFKCKCEVQDDSRETTKENIESQRGEARKRSRTSRSL